MNRNEQTILSSLTQTYPSRLAHERAVKRAFLKYGVTPVKAEYDAAGNCLQCGECGRCPGWHLPPGKERNDENQVIDP